MLATILLLSAITQAPHIHAPPCARSAGSEPAATNKALANGEYALTLVATEGPKKGHRVTGHLWLWRTSARDSSGRTGKRAVDTDTARTPLRCHGTRFRRRWRPSNRRSLGTRASARFERILSIPASSFSLAPSWQNSDPPARRFSLALSQTCETAVGSWMAQELAYGFETVTTSFEVIGANGVFSWVAGATFVSLPRLRDTAA